MGVKVSKAKHKKRNNLGVKEAAPQRVASFLIGLRGNLPGTRYGRHHPVAHWAFNR
jgi:hypothetical protein